MGTQPRQATAVQSTALDLLIVGAVVLLITLLAVPSADPLARSGVLLMNADVTSSSTLSVELVEE